MKRHFKSLRELLAWVHDCWKEGTCSRCPLPEVWCSFWHQQHAYITLSRTSAPYVYHPLTLPGVPTRVHHPPRSLWLKGLKSGNAVGLFIGVDIHITCFVPCALCWRKHSKKEICPTEGADLGANLRTCSRGPDCSRYAYILVPSCIDINMYLSVICMITTFLVLVFSCLCWPFVFSRCLVTVTKLQHCARVLMKMTLYQ